MYLEELELGNENNLDEPVMPRSDDEFSDCDLDENERWWWQQWRHHWCTYYMYLSASASASQFWSLLNPSLSSSSSVVILAELHFHFTSPVGPTVAIPESPSEVFELIFTPSLMDTRQICMQKQWCLGQAHNWWTQGLLGTLYPHGDADQSALALDNYWSSDPALCYSPIADRISRD